MQSIHNADLNSQQMEAVNYSGGPSIILAGAGSGKTRVLIQKVIHLVVDLHVPPEEILMITFTNKAAGEMKERIAKKLGFPSTKQRGARGGLGFVGTFHSFCAKILRTHGAHIGLRKDYVIYTDKDQQDLLKQILKKVNAGRMTASYFSNKISEAKNQLIAPDEFLKTFSYYKSAQVAEVYQAYQSQLTQYHAVDFDDLIMLAVRLLRTEGSILAQYQTQYTHVMIDEFQDTNIAQYALAKLLSPSDKDITVVGDFSQAIYSWRGADIRNLERFSEDYPTAKVFYLEQNYRSSQQILDYAYSKIIENQTHPILKLFTHAELGNGVTEFEAENEEHEALYIGKNIAENLDELPMSTEDPYSAFAVLYRTNAQSRILEEVFLKYGIPYTLVGGTRFYDRKEVRDVIAYLRLIIEPNDPVAVERIFKLGKRRFQSFITALPDLQQHAVHTPPETILELTLAKTNYLETFNREDPEDYARIENIRELKNVAATQGTLTEFFEQIALIENEYSVGERSKNKGKGVRLMSLHASKGLEFDTVFITGLEDGLLPHVRSLEDSYAIEEERRLFYVGITRARKKLYVTWAKRRGIYGRSAYGTKSRFIVSEKDLTPYDPDPSVTSSGDDWEW
ncbi:UvrD-helicase domain-containing protein [Candidatus Woesebacteria bacterium]|nr:UvrD-helicase domain-containing protein [Candidatus Woesebacteria bacterium]